MTIRCTRLFSSKDHNYFTKSCSNISFSAKIAKVQKSQKLKIESIITNGFCGETFQSGQQDENKMRRVVVCRQRSNGIDPPRAAGTRHRQTFVMKSPLLTGNCRATK